MCTKMCMNVNYIDNLFFSLKRWKFNIIQKISLRLWYQRWMGMMGSLKFQVVWKELSICIVYLEYMIIYMRFGVGFDIALYWYTYDISSPHTHIITNRPWKRCRTLCRGIFYDYTPLSYTHNAEKFSVFIVIFLTCL